MWRKMGVFGAFFGRRGVVGFSGALFGVSSGVVGFIVAMFLRAAREKVHPAWLVGGDSGTKFALLGQNLPNWAFLGEQGEFYTGSGAVRLVQGEFCLAVAPPLFTVAWIPSPAGTADRACRLWDGLHAGDRGGFAALEAGCRRVAGVSDL